MSIFVVDDHPLLREAVVMLIRRLNSKLNVVELDRMAAIGPAMQTHGKPELICLDLKLPDTNGVSGVRELKQQMPEVPLVVLSAAAAQDYEDLALEAGAQAYVAKSAGPAEITNKLRALLMKEGAEPSAPPEKLSKRQKQLLIMLDKGLSNRDIADELEISEHTVKVHLWRLFRRLNVKSRSQASHLARTQGLV
ncbi:MAG: response regulator transcription factor [Comamonadaceae bacterium]|jgi:DNA-binding NarL/FixJ family response regulator|nr:response regulator transcription factor [Comamonadaceae bacterium]